jgi:ribokinase
MMCVDTYVTVSSLPAAGWKVIGHALGELDGGVTGNFAVAAARLGAEVRAIGWSGTDAASQRGVRSLQSEGVDVSQVRRREGHPVFRTIVLVDERGDRSVVLLPPDDTAPPPQPDVLHDALRAMVPDLCYVGPWDSRASDIGECARAAGATVAATVESDALPAKLDWVSLRTVDLLFMSEETATASGWSARQPAVAPDWWARGPGVVVITLGAAGARYATTADGTWFEAAAPRVETVDTTGAGDAFAAAFCTFWQRGLRGVPLLARANAAGALAATALGPRAGMPPLERVEELARTTTGTSEARP